MAAILLIERKDAVFVMRMLYFDGDTATDYGSVVCKLELHSQMPQASASRSSGWTFAATFRQALLFGTFSWKTSLPGVRRESAGFCTKCEWRGGRVLCLRPAL